ncbi:phosphonopyruvate decarboxylase, partial [Candidatus Pacearchaeota archaeon]
PHLDEIAKSSKIDYCYTIREGVAPQSSSAVLSLLGYDPYALPRGPIEALGAGVKITSGDLAFRTNFATIDNLETMELLDRRAGRTLTTKEAKQLAKAINEKVKLPYKFEFYATVQHRGVLVIRGGFSDNISNMDPAYGRGVALHASAQKLRLAKPLDDDENSKLSAEIVNSFVRQSYEVLSKHPVNIKRAKKGLFAANVILCRDAGNTPPKLKKLRGKWLALAYLPLEIGIARAAGMDVKTFPYPKMRSIDVYSNLFAALKKATKQAVKVLKKNKDKYDYFYIHLKETDVPGHDNKPHEKVKMIEMIDKRFFSFLKKFIVGGKLVLTADHTTACKLKAHTSDPVPVLIYPSPSKRKQGGRFTESDGRQGKKLIARKLLEEYLLSR